MCPCLVVPALRALNRFAQVEVGEALFVVGDRRQLVFNFFVRDDDGLHRALRARLDRGCVRYAKVRAADAHVDEQAARAVTASGSASSAARAQRLQR